jgi:hypothetical protein
MPTTRTHGKKSLSREEELQDIANGKTLLPRTRRPPPQIGSVSPFKASFVKNGPKTTKAATLKKAPSYSIALLGDSTNHKQKKKKRPRPKKSSTIPTPTIASPPPLIPPLSARSCSLTGLKDPNCEREDVLADLRDSGLLNETDPCDIELLLNGTFSMCFV